MRTTDWTSQPLRFAMIFLFFWAFFLSSLPAETAQAAGALPVANPDFNPSPGTFTGSVSVRITTRTSGATIRYTTNGSNPTLSSTVYSSPLVFNSTTTLKARAFKAGMYDSGATTGTYTITVRVTPPPTLTFTATSTTIDSGKSAKLTWAATNATSCTASGGWSGTKGVSGSASVQPTSTTPYTLTCSGSGGSVTRSVTITVNIVISLTPCLPNLDCSRAMTTTDIKAGESVVFSVATGTASLPSGGLAARFGLEFRVGSPNGLNTSCYAARSVDVGLTNYESIVQVQSQSSGVPETGSVLLTTAQNTTYYMRCINQSSFIATRVFVQADLKEIKVYPRGPAVSASTDNYFVVHGRQDNYSSFQTLVDKLAVKINNTTSRFFRIDWSGGAASNYPSSFGLQGSRFIIPAGRALQQLVVTGQGVPASKINVWGHSWGSYVSSEFAKTSSSNFQTLVGLDPAETTPLGGFIGNKYSGPSLRANTSHSFALVATHGLYGGEDEADTAHLSTRITAKKNNASGDILRETYSGPLHSVPIRCMEYSLSHTDAVSQALVASALNQTEKIIAQNSNPDATMEGYTNDTGFVYLRHGPLINGSRPIQP